MLSNPWFMTAEIVQKSHSKGIDLCKMGWTKGQLISKCLFGIFNSPKKCMNEFGFTTMDTSSRIVFVRFLGELKTPKRHFEINWPLGLTG